MLRSRKQVAAGHIRSLPMKEKRKTRRRYLLYYMRVYDVGTKRQIGNLVDITPQGAMIVSEDPIEDGKTLQIRMELTSDVSDHPFMEFSARSKWCEPDINPDMYNIGLEITEISPEDIKTIRRIVKQFSFRDNRLAK
jgi:hypothetical protein